jgi:hypothetical protein
MRLLIYDFKDFTYKEDLIVSNDFELILDTVITQSSYFVCNVPTTLAIVGDIVVLHERAMRYVGVIDKIVHAENSSIRLNTLDYISCLDFEFIRTGGTYANGYYLKDLLLARYRDCKDLIQRKPYLRYHNYAESVGGSIPLENKLIKFSDLLKECNSLFDLRIETRVGFQGFDLEEEYKDTIPIGTITHLLINFRCSKRKMKLKDSLPQLINLEISSNDEVRVNKIEFIPDVGVINKGIKEYYLLTEKDEVTTNELSTKRYPYVKSKTLTYSEKETDKDLLDRASIELKKEEYKHSISFEIDCRNDVFVPFDNINLGDRVEFITDNKIYKTLVSQIRYKGSLDYCSVILGENRITLTDKIKLIKERK